MMRSVWNFATAGQLTFGEGAVDQLGSIVRRRNWRRVAVITDRVLIAAGVLEPVLRSLQGEQCLTIVFDGGAPEPSLDVVCDARDQTGPFRPDCLVGVGGGSNLDLAKLTAVLLAHGGSPSDYFGFDRVPGPVLPLICIPTTAGTGSEVSHAAVVTDAVNQIKVSTLSSYLRPSVAIVDPCLTYSCPKSVAADSGIDALTHAIEAMTANDFDQLPVPPGEQCAYEGRYHLGVCLAESAIQLIGQHLRSAVTSGDHRAKNGMALAATMAGMAFSNCGVALVHALEYPLGGALHCSHGAGNGLLLPFVMRFNLPQRYESFARIAQLLGCDISGLDLQQAAHQAVCAVEDIRREIGIPERIRDIGGTPDQLAGFAEKAYAIKRLLSVNPRMASQQDLLDIYQSAF